MEKTGYIQFESIFEIPAKDAVPLEVGSLQFIIFEVSN